MKNAVENAQRADVSTQSQSVKPFTDHWASNDSDGSRNKSSWYWGAPAQRWEQYCICGPTWALFRVNQCFFVKDHLAILMSPSFFGAKLALLSRWSLYRQSLKTLRPKMLILFAAISGVFWKTGDTINWFFLMLSSLHGVELNQVAHLIEDTFPKDASIKDTSLFRRWSVFL